MPSPDPLPVQRVAVTAIGVVSPLGIGPEATYTALREGHDCVAPVERFDVSRTRCKTAGQVDPEALGDFTSRKDRRLHVASRMMIAAARQLQEADPEFQPDFAVLGTTSGGMSFGEQFFRAETARRNPPKRAGWLANYLPHKAVQDAQEACGFSAPSQIIANACASGTNAVGHAFALVRGGRHRRVLCGGYDVIAEMVYVGFDSLQASTPERIRPFDKGRTGLVLGEGAALLALEAWDSAIERGAPILAEITGYGISTDNFHLTQPNPSGI
ncbi:MAG TPA: beta-ketoacyl synthase N-terminal-like domain-containing protein, partial [Chthoniobacteraceae bacterium]